MVNFQLIRKLVIRQSHQYFGHKVINMPQGENDVPLFNKVNYTRMICINIQLIEGYSVPLST